MTTFMGYKRSDGKVGVRNHVIAVATVACVNGVVEQLAARVPEVIPLVHIDGCYSFVNSPYFTRTVLNVCCNPNHYAVIIIGLGCECDNAKELGEKIAATGKKVFSAITQEDGGSMKVLDAACEAARAFVKETEAMEREPCDIGALILGTECGGSDALSGITANPAIGHLSDWIVSKGGTSILSESDELKGCEAMLAERAATPEIAQKIWDIIPPWPEQRFDKDYLKGGMTNILEKSLGCLSKGGTSTVMGVSEYGEDISGRKGLIIMDGTGYDPESCTGLVASGAQIIVFSSGHGNPLGFPSAPTIKICSNPVRYIELGGDSMESDIDINAGAIISEGISAEEMGDRLVKFFIDVANGKQTKPELHKHGGLMCIYRNTIAF